MNAMAQTQNEKTRRRDFFLRAFLVLFLAVAVLVFVFRAAAGFSLPFQGIHAHVSGHFCTMAKTFAKLGVIGLGGVPMENNPPLGNNPPVYLHWPPLFPATLGIVFKLFGPTEATARLFVLLIVLANAFLVAAIARRAAGLEAGLFAAAAYLLSPIVLRYGQLILHVHYAVFWMLLAFLAVILSKDGHNDAGRWRFIGAAAAVLSVASSWEPVLAYAGAFFVSLVLRQKENTKRFFLYGALGACTAAVILFLYVVQYPHLFDRFFHVVLYRAGVVDTYYVDSEKFPLPSIAVILKGYVKQSLSLGFFPLASVAAVLIFGLFNFRTRKDDRFAPVLAGLTAVGVLWYAGMAAHAFYHDYEMLVAAPVAAICAGLVLHDISRRISSGKNETRAFILRFVTAFVAFFLITTPLSSALKLINVQSRTDAELSAYGREIHGATTDGSVVFTSLSNQVVAFYADRRMVWKIVSDDGLEKALEKARLEFPESTPFFLAVPRAALDGFTRVGVKYPHVRDAGNIRVFALND